MIIGPSESWRIGKAVLTNQLAKIAPAFYLRMTRETGRGKEENISPRDIADYLTNCFFEYFRILGIQQEKIEQTIAGKTILEYGPGNILGVPILFIAYGAKKVYCSDKFKLINFSGENIKTLQCILESLDQEKRNRAFSSFRIFGQPESGLNPEKIDYRINKNGLSNLENEADWVISRAVLEHVNDLNGTLDDIFRSIKPGGISIHLVDLRSHGLHRYNLLDFLEWPETLWQLMYSQKGAPNRYRIDEYRRLLGNLAFRKVDFEITSRAAENEVEAIRYKLSEKLSSISSDDLACLGFWMICRK